MAATVKRFVARHGPPIKAHFVKHAHWHAVGVGAVVLGKDFVAALFVDFMKTHL